MDPENKISEVNQIINSNQDVQNLLNQYGGGEVPLESAELIEEYFLSNHENTSSDNSDGSDDDSFEDTIIGNLSCNEDSFPCINAVDTEDTDEQIVENFISNGCGCKWNCTSKFPVSVIKSSRLDCLDLDERCNMHVNHHHLLVLGALNSICAAESTILKEKRPNTTRKRSCYSNHFFRGKLVCKEFFKFVFACGERRLRTLKQLLANSGIQPQQHGNYKNLSSVKSISVDARKMVVTFINNYADQNGLCLPGRIPAFSNPDLKVLPSSLTKIKLYEDYKKALTSTGAQPIGKSSWYNIWNTFCENIVIQKPKSDLCQVCQQNIESISTMQSLSEEIKQAKLESSLRHLERVKIERQHYKTTVETSKDFISTLPTVPIIGMHLPCSIEGTVHYSFDYAQQVHLPFSSQQVGPIFFLTPFKISLFGVAVEPLGKFVLYIIPENVNTGKGSNVVISLLHHFFKNFGLGESHAYLHADNCCGQNKNNFLMQYLVYRIINNLHKKISISFLPVGHTKFAPDLYFGLFKKSFRRSEVNSISDLTTVAERACPSAKSIVTFILADTDGKINAPTYNWKEYFGTCSASPIPGILQFYHFETDYKQPGQIRFKKSLEEELSTSQVFPNPNLEIIKGIPDCIKPLGLSFERQKYLYEKIRDFVSDPFKDELCPAPVLIASSNSATNEMLLHVDSNQVLPSSPSQNKKQNPLTNEQTPSSAAATSDSPKNCPPEKAKNRKPQTCGLCKETGHNKRKCPKKTAKSKDNCSIDKM